jgi:ABC-type cobalamin/Fe3+-siderophores transport system ATPase subunit
LASDRRGASGERELPEGARRALGAVGLAGFERPPIETPSAGQFQRVLFARLIVQDAELILLDEPLAAVDWRTSEDLLRFIVGRERGEPLQNSSGQVSIWEMNATTVAARAVLGNPGPTWHI